VYGFGLNPISEQLCLAWILPKTASAADCVHVILRLMPYILTPAETVSEYSVTVPQVVYKEDGDGVSQLGIDWCGSPPARVS